MKTIRIRRDVRERLESFADGKSVNKAMRLLLEDVETGDEQKAVEKVQYININFDDELLPKLRVCKAYPNESYSDVIDRLITQKLEK